MRKLIIIGAGGHGKVVADIAQKMNTWQEITFLDDDETVRSSLGFKVVGTLNDMLKFSKTHHIFIAIGNNKVREKLHRRLKEGGAVIPTLVHPNSVIGLQVEIGEGTVLMAGTIVNCDTRIGAGCIINTGATIDHDCDIGNFTHVSPGARIAGTVRCGERTWIGVGATVSNNVEITSEVIVGAGAVVIKDIRESGTYVGVPARRV